MDKTNTNRELSPKYLAHYYRQADLYCGPNLAHWRRWPSRGLDASGIKAVVFLQKWKGNRSPWLETYGKPSWSSGFAKFEERVAAIGATYREGAFTARQAA
jgi:hypothetical protein